MTKNEHRRIWGPGTSFAFLSLNSALSVAQVMMWNKLSIPSSSCVMVVEEKGEEGRETKFVVMFASQFFLSMNLRYPSVPTPTRPGSYYSIPVCRQEGLRAGTLTWHSYEFEFDAIAMKTEKQK